jgi:hypothetical protein
MKKLCIVTTALLLALSITGPAFSDNNNSNNSNNPPTTSGGGGDSSGNGNPGRSGPGNS